MAFTTTEVGATQDDIILSIVQEELLSRAVVRPSIMDMSDQAVKGVDEIKIPKFSSSFSGPAAQNPDGVTETAFQTLDLDTDTLALDQWKNLPYRIVDRIEAQNRVNLEATMAQSAGQQMAIDIDSYIITQMATATTTVDLGGTADDEMTLEAINEARAELKKANVTDLGGELFLLVSPELEKDMLNIDNFISAEKYGSREALLNGEIGRVYGMRVLVSNLLADDEGYAYHRSCLAFAAQKDVSFERQRADVRIQGNDYSFSVGYGAVLLDGGSRIVKFVDPT